MIEKDYRLIAGRVIGFSGFLIKIDYLLGLVLLLLHKYRHD